ncbi:MAG TPA: DUF4097 family beta strand repeat protein [Candidatus Hydrogenedentes bacterium]|nr:DUF4097 family beta strand repeat protein [Candidatus Hydrogenedentota bacterium]
MELMKGIGILVVLFFGMVVVLRSGFGHAEATDVSEDTPSYHTATIKEERPLNDKGSVTVINKNGAIRITAWDKPSVAIVAHKEVGIPGIRKLFRLGRKEAPPSKALDTIQVEVTGDERTLRIETKYLRARWKLTRTVRYEIRVPKTATLDLRTSNGSVEVANVLGDVSLTSSNGKLACENVRGAIKAETSNGNISCLNVGGPVDAKTLNGSIQLEHAGSLSDADAITCKTTNGSITAAFPSGSAFDLEAKTTLGSITTDFPIAVSGKLAKKSVIGAVGDGGPTVRLMTTNGKIRILKI